jgi:hypothetical protein
MVAGWKGLPVVAALVLVGAVSFTLVAAYQWAGRLGILVRQPRWPRAIGKATFGKATSGTRARHHPLAGLVLWLTTIPGMSVPKVGNSISSVGQLTGRAARLASRMTFDFEELDYRSGGWSFRKRQPAFDNRRRCVMDQSMKFVRFGPPLNHSISRSPSPASSRATTAGRHRCRRPPGRAAPRPRRPACRRAALG